MLRIFCITCLAAMASSANGATRQATPASFSAVLASAAGGDTIILAPGRYDMTIKNASHRSIVTITGPGAVLTGLTVHRSRGLRFEKLDFYSAPDGPRNPFVVRSSEDIHFKNINHHGSMDADPRNDQAGLMIRDSSNVTVVNSEYQQLFIAISHLNSRDLTISGNSFHDLQMDGVRGGGSDRVVVSDNHFTDFYPKPGDHPDAIQFWGANTTTSASDITVAGNTILRGKGDPMQGVFIRDGSGERPFKNVVISDNLIVGGMYHGISVDNAVGVRVERNVVTGFGDMKSWIRTQKVSQLLLTSNRSQLFLVEGKNLKLPGSGNKVIPPVKDGGARLLRERDRPVSGPQVRTK